MELVKYDAMVHAIAICESVDEVKDVRDKALALEAYAKQAKNFDAERKCATVRVRAERKCGELLAGLEKNSGKRNDLTCFPEGKEVVSEYKAARESINLSDKQAASFQKLAAIEEDVFEERIQAVLEEDSNKPTASKIINNTRGTTGTGDNEWYTPKKYIDTARKVMGEITLDPASSELANQMVDADEFITQEMDGLETDWASYTHDGEVYPTKVWMNPPYAQPYIEQFMVKLSDECFCGNVSEAIALTHNYTDTKWFQYAQERCSAICFTRGRIAFESPTGEKAAPTQGQAFFYFGPNVDRFFREFSQYGFVVQRVSML